MRVDSGLIPSGINQHNRALLERLHRHGGVLSVDETARVLEIDRLQAGRLLVYLARRGWLSRLQHGLYVPVPLGASWPGDWVPDPFVVAERIFSPCYIGGWSAAQHWGLVPQLSNAVSVVTVGSLRRRHVLIQGVPYRVTARLPRVLFGTATIVRGGTEVQLSDPARTLVDLLDDPKLAGGVRVTAQAVVHYLSSEHRDRGLLVDYGDRLGNRALFKRLGYILEQQGLDAPGLMEACLRRRSSGLVSLDPSVKSSGRIVRRWGLRVNVSLAATVGGGTHH